MTAIEQFNHLSYNAVDDRPQREMMIQLELCSRHNSITLMHVQPISDNARCEFCLEIVANLLGSLRKVLELLQFLQQARMFLIGFLLLFIIDIKIY